MPRKKLTEKQRRDVAHFYGEKGWAAERVAAIFKISARHVRRVSKSPHMKNSKLTDEQVDEIRERYESEPVSTRMLGREYGVSNTHISRIINGKRRKGCTD